MNPAATNDSLNDAANALRTDIIEESATQASKELATSVSASVERFTLSPMSCALTYCL
jgi:hypothetical protein